MKTKTCVNIIISAFLLLSGLSWNPAAAASIMKVWPGGLTYGDCLTWGNACDLQYALGIASSGDEIWVGAGMYFPGDTRDDTFQLKGGVEIYGSFPWGAVSRDERGLGRYPSGLSGDIGEWGIDTDNVYRVVTGISVTPTAVLDSFYINYAYNDRSGVSAEWGGGIYLEESNVTLSNLKVQFNHARAGAGLFIMGSPTSIQVLDQIMFIKNHSFINGGGLHTHSASALELNDIVFDDNTADNDGGGMYNLYSSPTMTNIEFTRNQATRNGGGIHNKESTPVLTNATFWGNQAFAGGAFSNEWYSSSALENVTFFNNTAPAGSSIFNYTPSDTTLINSILWNNAYPQIGGDPATTTYSDIQGGYDGLGDEIGNIDIDPMLSPLNYYGGFTRYMPLLNSSLAIDAGSPDFCPAFDQRGMYRPIDGDHDGTPRCDMGAYEYPYDFLFLPLINNQ